MNKLTPEQIKSTHIKTIVQNPYIVKALVKAKIVHLIDLVEKKPYEMRSIIGGITPATINDWLSIVHTIEEIFHAYLPDYYNPLGDWCFQEPPLHDKGLADSDLRIQTMNTLYHYGIRNFRDVLELQPNQLKNLERIGDSSYAEICKELRYNSFMMNKPCIAAYVPSANGSSWLRYFGAESKYIPLFTKITSDEYEAMNQ